MTCTVEDCPRPTLARGWCNAHYKRWRKTGDPQGSVPRKRPTSCVNGHLFDEVNTYLRVDGKRSCRMCARFFARRWHRKARAAGRRFSQASPEWKTQYQSEVRAGIRVPKPHPKSSVKVSATLLDLLTVDRGWWTAEALAFRLGLKPGSVRTSLNRLEVKGRVQRRREPQIEWKSLPPAADSG